MNRVKITILITILLIVGYYIFKTVRANIVKNSYDLIIVGADCSTGPFSGSYNYTVGIKNGKVKEISNIFSEDRSNINIIVKCNDMITYVSYDSLNDNNDDLKERCYSFFSEEYNEKVKEGHDIYDYKEKDLKAFNNILDILDEKEKDSLTYFIITEKNYYISEGHKIFKYNEVNNTLDSLLDLKACTGIDYFYEK